jgi:hypothetical protein
MSAPLLRPGDIPKPMTSVERRRLAHIETLDRLCAEAGRPVEAYRCTYCRETKEGRFRRPQERSTASGQGWTQGSRYPVWICHACDQAQGTAPEGIR